MKVHAFILLFAVCYVECRKILQPIDKSANTAFINMEGGGGARPAPSQGPAPVKPAGPTPAQPATTPKPAPPQVQPAIPAKPAATTTTKPVASIKQEPAAPKPTPGQIAPKPVNPPHVTNPITTPGPGSVKQLVNFYDSQGKASPIRPYSYSQAVKQG